MAVAYKLKFWDIPSQFVTAERNAVSKATRKLTQSLSLIIKPTYQMNKDFTEAMAQRSDEELIKILTIHKQDYQPEAVQCAEIELKKRNLSLDEVHAIEEELKVDNEQQKGIESNVASSIIRLVNLLVDTISFLILLYIIDLTLTILFIGNNPFLWGFITFALFIMLYFAYYIVLEAKYGKTFGKMLTKTMVVKSNGEKPTTSDIFIRTICRFIPFDQLSYIFTKNGFHDYLSKTIVVKDTN